MTTHATVGPGRAADRPSALAINPRNREASVTRRRKLLAAFDALPADARAGLLEAAETVAHAHGQVSWAAREELRDGVRQLYVAAGWDA